MPEHKLFDRQRSDFTERALKGLCSNCSVYWVILG